MAVILFLSLIVGNMFEKMLFQICSFEANQSAMERKQDKLGLDRYKMVLLVRRDLKMGTGKIAAQCCHAAIGIYEKLQTSQFANLRNSWDASGQAKVALRVESLQELEELEDKAKQLNLLTYKVRDAGHTQVEPGSVTVLAIGPQREAVVDSVTRQLKLL